MRKLACERDENIEVRVAGSGLPAILITLLLLIGLGPLVLDGCAPCLSNWREVMGVSSNVQTPALDNMQDAMRATSESFWLTVNPYLHRLPWEPKAVLPSAALVTILAMLMLRR